MNKPRQNHTIHKSRHKWQWAHQGQRTTNNKHIGKEEQSTQQEQIDTGTHTNQKTHTKQHIQTKHRTHNNNPQHTTTMNDTL